MRKEPEYKFGWGGLQGHGLNGLIALAMVVVATIIVAAIVGYVLVHVPSRAFASLAGAAIRTRFIKHPSR